MTKLSGTLPKDYNEDGLGSINADLVEAPHETRVVIALVDCKSITTDIDTGLDQATARILHIEPLKDEDAQDRARELLLEAQERRTGRKALPLVNGATGEVDGTAAAILRKGAGIIADGVTEIRFNK
ncbi:hypothetical protein [Arthrobacter sp. 18067]|uniref:hypothetical protein n=1 Tax=Arthrobacter sp. 18067 TaxID=2681413 RepID=UPI001359EB39|nr:hypothetical protein [Arthrobacter sp. 18067]